VHTATIMDNDSEPVVSFEEDSQSAVEDTGTMTVRVELDHSTGSDVSVQFVVSGTADGGGTDYTLITASPVTIPAGDTEVDIEIRIEEDTLVEDDETVILTMGTVTNATKGTTDVHTATIMDNDSEPVVSFEEDSQSVGEDVDVIQVRVELNHSTGSAVTVEFSVSGSSTAEGEGTDYTLLTASPVTIPAGDTEVDIEIRIEEDTLVENDETVILTMGTVTSATKGTPDEHTVAIVDNDSLPDVSFTSPSSQNVGEDAGTIQVWVALDPVISSMVSVDVTVSGTADADDTNPSIIGTFTVDIPANENGVYIDITIVDDDLVEDDETINLTLSNPSNAVLGTNIQYEVTIEDNDLPICTVTVSFVADANKKVTWEITNTGNQNLLLDELRVEFPDRPSHNKYGHLTTITFEDEVWIGDKGSTAVINSWNSGIEADRYLMVANAKYLALLFTYPGDNSEINQLDVYVSAINGTCSFHATWSP